MAWERYDSFYENYIAKNLPEDELDRVQDRDTEIVVQYEECTIRISDCLTQMKQTSTKRRSAKSAPSSKRLKNLKDLRRDIEMKKLKLEQEKELAQFELDVERKKIELEFEKKKRACELKFQIQIAEKEAQLLEDDRTDSSSQRGLGGKSGFEFLPTKSVEEKIEKWRASCADKNKKAKHDPEQSGKKDPLGEGCRTLKSKVQRDKLVMEGNQTSAILLKLTMFQGMNPIKLSSDYPTFRNRLRDNLEDGILNDSQKLEFFPKFLSGEAYEVVERVSGCSYDSVLRILHERYGQPATVTAACIASLTKGPKLQNNDNTGLLNFAEQLEAASKKFSGHYELQASTMANLRQIVTRLPNYLVNKWGEVSYSIREKGGMPRLSDLSKFVRRQAAIKNDPGFVAEKKAERQNAMNIKGPTSNSRGHTNAFNTDLEAGGLSVNYQNPEKRNLRRCLRCSKDHELAECEQFISNETQGRWDIVKQNKLCHVCLKWGHMRGRCEWRIFCSCGSDRRHHRLLHNPPRLRDAITARDPHLDRLREIEAAQANIHYKDQGTEFPQNPRAIEQYATITEAPSRTILLHVVPVKAISPSGSSLTTYVLLHNASRGTIISKNIADSLGLKGPLQLVSVNTVVEKTREHFQLVRFELQSATGTGEIIKVEEGLVSEKFNIPERCLPDDIDNSCYPHLKDIEIP